MAELTLTETRPAPGPASSPVSGTVRPVSPADHLGAVFAAAEVTGPRAVALREVPFLTMVGLRAEPGSGAAERLTTTLGVRLPTRCGGVVSSGGRGDGTAAVWLGPDEWLAVSDREPAALTQSLSVALHGEAGSVVDLSANRTTLELSGPSARDALEKGCSLDLHPRAFVVGAAYATALAGIPVVLWRTEEQTFRVLVRSSFADHVGRWLVDAIAEYGSRELG